MRRLVPFTVLLGASLFAAGCRQAPGLVPVSGRVTLDDKPVQQMLVNLTPLGDTQGNGALACTDSEGRFTLLDSRGGAGAYVGEYKVSFYPSASRSKCVMTPLQPIGYTAGRPSYSGSHPGRSSAMPMSRSLSSASATISR